MPTDAPREREIEILRRQLDEMRAELRDLQADTAELGGTSALARAELALPEPAGPVVAVPVAADAPAREISRDAPTSAHRGWSE